MKAFVLAIIIAGATALYFGQLATAAAGAENQALRQSKAEAESLQSENQKLRALPDSPAKLAELRRQHVELMRLRGEVAAMRHSASMTPEELRESIAKARSDSEADDALVLKIQTDVRAKERSGEIAQGIIGLGSVLRAVTRKNGNVPPTSFGQAQELVERLFDGNPRREPFLKILTNTAGPSTARDFEFLPAPTVAIADTEQRLLLREREPRLQPDGTWKRFYAYSGQKFSEATQPTRDFNEWERAEMIIKAGP